MPIKPLVARFSTLCVLCSCLLLSGALAFAGGDKVNLNTATAEQLQMVTGIGPVLAQRILDYRSDHGSFKTVDDLTNVKGVGEAKLVKLRDALTVEVADQSGKEVSLLKK